MTPIQNLQLYHLSWEEPAFAADPHPHFRAARKVHPWLAKSNAGYVVFDLDAIRAILVQDDKLRTSFGEVVDIMEARGSSWGRFAQEQMIALPDEEHRLLRDSFARKFTPRYANELRPLMRETMSSLLDEWVAKGRFDFEEFASYYPVAVTTRMIGASLDEIPVLRSSMETLGLAFSMDKSLVPALDQATEELDRFAQRLLADRKANPRGTGETDLLDMLIDAGRESNVSDRRLADLLIFLFVAGYDTSKNVLTYMMRTMIRNPEAYERCARDHEYCRKVVEESMRMFTPASTFRVTMQEIVYRDVVIPKDTMLFFTLSVAGRVADTVEDPDTFDPERRPAPLRLHVGFGMGKHICLGQYIARAQLQEGLHLIAQRMPEPKEAGPVGWRPFPGVWGLNGLPIEIAA